MTELKFNEKEHKYTYGDTELTSVTTWLSQFSKPFDMKEATKNYAGYLKRNGYVHVDNKKITPSVIKKHWDFIRDEGTRVHRQIEGLVNREKIFPKPNKKARDAYEYVEGELRKLNKPRAIPEQKIYNLDYGLAGMMDFPVYHTTDEGELVMTLYDWKIVDNMTPDKLKKYTLQLSTYALMSESLNPDWKIQELKLIQVTDEGVKVHNIEYKKEEVIQKLKESGRWQ